MHSYKITIGLQKLLAMEGLIQMTGSLYQCKGFSEVLPKSCMHMHIFLREGSYISSEVTGVCMPWGLRAAAHKEVFIGPRRDVKNKNNHRGVCTKLNVFNFKDCILF